MRNSRLEALWILQICVAKQPQPSGVTKAAEPEAVLDVAVANDSMQRLGMLGEGGGRTAQPHDNDPSRPFLVSIATTLSCMLLCIAILENSPLPFMTLILTQDYSTREVAWSKRASDYPFHAEDPYIWY